MTTPLSLNLPTSLTSGLTGQSQTIENTVSQKVSAENNAANLNNLAPVKEKEQKTWKLPNLKNFKLDPALQKANQHAYNHLQNVLTPDGMYVEIQQPSTKNLENSEITIKEKGSEKTLKTYNEQSILQLYAHHQHRQSVIVDGKI